jgi:hypothetical protein
MFFSRKITAFAKALPLSVMTIVLTSADAERTYVTPGPFRTTFCSRSLVGNGSTNLGGGVGVVVVIFVVVVDVVVVMYVDGINEGAIDNQNSRDRPSFLVT